MFFEPSDHTHPHSPDQLRGHPHSHEHSHGDIVHSHPHSHAHSHEDAGRSHRDGHEAERARQLLSGTPNGANRPESGREASAKETFDIRDLRPISKDPESSGPIVLLVGTDPDAYEDEYYNGDYSTEGLLFPLDPEVAENLRAALHLQSGDGDYGEYRDYLFAADYGDDFDVGPHGDVEEGPNEGLLINSITVDDTKWAWKTPGLSDDEDVDISIHGNKWVLLLRVAVGEILSLLFLAAETSWRRTCPSAKRRWCRSRRAPLFGAIFRQERV